MGKLYKLIGPLNSFLINSVEDYGTKIVFLIDIDNL